MAVVVAVTRRLHQQLLQLAKKSCNGSRWLSSSASSTNRWSCNDSKWLSSARLLKLRRRLPLPPQQWLRSLLLSGRLQLLLPLKDCQLGRLTPEAQLLPAVALLPLK